ncbi:hypothetical protein [Streptomyces sp. NPDC001741]|uniref:hypothetical protein n=1 Tax=Streptomyces sp. NPDC001741 TaxID=3364605 RepID=UPI00367673C9
MKTPSWFSQPYPPEGASAAEGIRNQLGRPELDLLTILVRESAQNSWDARLPASPTPVDYRIDMWTVGPAHTRAWRLLLLDGAPAAGDSFPLNETLRRNSIRVLAVSDRGTRGLGGPTRADTFDAERDFVSFIRNIGEPRDTALGGGTYGFGKGIFYLLSNAGTILVHSRCRTEEGGFETRLIGCTLWKSYVANEPDGMRRYTGRHWWGDTSGDVVEPLIDGDADAVVRSLGLHPFGAGETGTTIIVVDPILEDRTPVEAADYLAETITWHLWPKMIESAEKCADMRFAVTCDGVDRPVPDPRQTRPINMFVAAYEKMAGQNAAKLHCHRPKKYLGKLGLEKRIMPPFEPSPASRMVGLENLVHHVCLMRPAELVVTYRPGPKPPSVNQGYAGVFRADETMDDVYAKAEPPTHDAWNPQSLERPDSTFVHTTFRRIGEELDGLLSLGGTARTGSSNVALGAASSLFSKLVGGTWGIGGATAYAKVGSQATRRRSNPHGGDLGSPSASDTGRALPSTRGEPAGELVGSGTDALSQPPPDDHLSAPVRRRPRVQYVGDPYYEDHGTSTLLVQEFRLPVPGRQRVRADLAVSLPGSGGRETDPPIGAAGPELVGWGGNDTEIHRAQIFETEGGEPLWRVLVLPAPDTVTEISIKVEAVTS